MLAISLRQPWPHAILCLGKDIENRTWHAPAKVLGQRVLIHASKTMDTEAAFNFIHQVTGVTIEEKDLARGCIVGSVIITGNTDGSDSPWFVGPIGWSMRDPWPSDFPIPCRGRPGFFEPNDFPTVKAEKQCQKLVQKLQG